MTDTKSTTKSPAAPPRYAIREVRLPMSVRFAGRTVDRLKVAGGPGDMTGDGTAIEAIELRIDPLPHFYVRSSRGNLCVDVSGCTWLPMD